MLNLQKLRVEFRDFALQDINLEVMPGDYFMIVGPTGSGKTVLLETIAGLHRVRSGEIRMDNKNITDLEPEKRRMAIVYQDCALFPHLSVAENIIFGLKVRKTDRKDIKQALEEIAATIGVAHLLHRKPSTLSGGERQKVALARSLIVKPDLLLLDEPLSALDPESRENAREELRRIHQRLNTTTIHVTHDFEEAISMGNRMAVLGQGQVKQIGTPEQIFRAPNSVFVARFTMARNIYEGKLHYINGGPVFSINGTDFTVAGAHDEGECYGAIRPEDIFISLEHVDPGIPNCFKGIISGIVDGSARLYVSIDLPLKITCFVTRQFFKENGLSSGQSVYIIFKPSAVHLFKK